MKESWNFVEPLNGEILGMFKNAARLLLGNPRLAAAALRMVRNQRSAAKRRMLQAKQDVHVPPFMVLSVTNRCNLKCAGCYNKAQNRPAHAQMDDALMDRVLGEAADLGTSVVLVSGGEPLMHPGVLPCLAGHPGTVFNLFTNGYLLDESKAAFLARHRHIIPVISMEGDTAGTDGRRGSGTYDKVAGAMALLKHKNVFFGTSVTLTRRNRDLVLSDAFITDLKAKGCRMFVMVEYVPFEEGTDDLALDPAENRAVEERIELLGKKHGVLVMSFPGGEEKFGGCLAAGRGFIHVNARGGLEPCPFSPYSDVDLNAMPLRDALGSPLLKTIRENADKLSETTGCALWENRGWVQAQLAATAR